MRLNAAIDLDPVPPPISPTTSPPAPAFPTDTDTQLFADQTDLHQFYSVNWTDLHTQHKNSYQIAHDLPEHVHLIVKQYTGHTAPQADDLARATFHLTATAPQRVAHTHRKPPLTSFSKGGVLPRTATDKSPKPKSGSKVHHFRSQLDSAADVSVHNIKEHFHRLRYSPGRIGSIGADGAKIFNYTHRGDIKQIFADAYGGDWIQHTMKDVRYHPNLESLTNSKVLYRSMGYVGHETAHGHTYTAPTGGVITAATDDKHNEYLDGWCVTADDSATAHPP